MRTTEDLTERMARVIMEAYHGGCKVTDWREAEWNPNVAEAIKNANAVLAIARPTIRKEALEEAAKVAETEGVYPELNVFAGGPEWYKHGKCIASAIRALATTGQEGGR